MTEADLRRGEVGVEVDADRVVSDGHVEQQCDGHHSEGRHQNHASRHGVYTAEHNFPPVLLPLPVSIHYLTKRLTSPVAASSGSLGLWPALAAVAILVAHVPSFVHRLLDGDEAIYGSIAVLMNMGGGLYADGGVDNKPPGIFWVYALTFRFFGAYQTWAVHTVAMLVMAATCVLIFLIARQLASPRAGVLAALFYGLLTAAGNPRLLAAHTEICMIRPPPASVLFMLRRRWFWTGLLLVVAFTFRQSAAVDVLLVGLAL